ncbi:MAG: carboxypeptidase regulatory-like domain-containing protein [Planctomycetota bacterium]
MTKRTLGLCVLALGAVVTLVAILARAPRSTPSPARGPIDEAPVASERATLAEPEASRRGDVDARVVATTSPPFEFSSATGALGARVVSSIDGEPLAHARLQLTASRPAPESEAHDAREGFVRFAYTDVSGRAEFPLEPGLSGELSVVEPWTDAPLASRAVEPLMPGERRELVFELDEGRTFGRVVRCDGATPVAGARVRALTTNGEPRRFEQDPPEYELGATATDLDGRFVLRHSIASAPFLRIEAAGLGSVRATLSRSRGTDSMPLAFCLDATATLRARAVDTHGMPLVARIEAVAQSSRAQSRLELASEPDLVDSLTCQTNADGTCELTGMPANLLVRVRASWRGEASRSADRYLALKPGEVRELRWTFGSGCHIEGRVLDADGLPIESRAVILQPRASQHAHVLHGNFGTGTLASTDADGRFAFEQIPAGAWWIGVAPTRGAEEMIALPEPIDVALDDRTRSVDLRLERGFFISGRVLDPFGEPVDQRMIEADSESGRCSAIARSDEQGNWRVGPLLAGRYRLSSVRRWPSMGERDDRSTEKSFAAAEPITISAGTSDVVLRLRTPGRILGDVSDARTGVACDASVMIVGPNASSTERVTTREGRFEIPLLAPGVYDIVASTADMRTGRVSAVRVTEGDAPPEISIEVEPGAVLRVHSEAPREGGWCTVLRGNEIVASGELPANQEYVCIVPPGTLTVRLEDASEPKPLEQSLDVRAGAQAFVHFSAER